MSVRRFFTRSGKDRELAQEMEVHIAEETDENVARGMSPDEAKRRAYVKFGNPQVVRENLWRQNTLTAIDNAWRDLKYAARTLTRSPGFSLMAVLVMALGIGGNVALFTVVRNVLLNPLPYPDSDKLVTMYEHENNHRFDEFSAYLPVDAASYTEWKQVSQGKAEMALVSPFQQFNVSAEGGKLPEQINAAWSSWNFFRTLRVTPAIGRDFTASDDRADATASVMLSHAFWKRRYSGDPAILGKSIWLDAKPYTVIGVMPESFVYSGAFGGNTVQVWTPVNHEAPPDLMATFEDHEFLVVTRLFPGTTLAGLVSQLNTVQARIKSDHPGPAVHDSVSGRSMLDDAVDDYKTPLYALLAATGCVLLIACLNVASLLVARTAARNRELAIRAALGGSRLRLLRERLMESTVLSAAGGTLGLLLAYGALQWLVTTRDDMNRIEAIHLDKVALAFALGATLLCAIFAGLISAMGSDGKQILATLQESSRSYSASGSRAGLRRLLLVVEVGLTVVLLVGAGLLLKSYQRLRSTDLGVPVDNVLTMHFSLPDGKYPKPEQVVAFFENVIGRVRAVPGVQTAGLVSVAPGQGWGGDHLVSVVEHPPLPKGEGPDMMVRGADPGYFAAIQIPLVEGRTFNLNERLERSNVVVISESSAKKLFPGENPIGKHLKDGAGGGIHEIVGVVGDTRWTIARAAEPTMYYPIYGNDYSGATVVIRSTHNVESLALPVQKIIGELDPDLPVSNVQTLRQAIGKSTVNSQFNSLLVLAFAVIALLLAAAGLYGVLAYLVTQRTSEIGIRIALGAKREQVLRLVLIDGIRPALIGLVLGLAASALAVRMIRSMLYETQPYDAPIFLVVSSILLVVAGAACLVPSWRASRLDPMQALRTE